MSRPNRTLPAGAGSALLAMAGFFMSIGVATSQSTEPLGGRASPKEPVLTLQGGYLSTYPRGSFPSVVMENSIAGTGEVPANRAEGGGGYSIGLDFVIPFSSHFLLDLYAGTRAWDVRYGADSIHFSTTFSLQTFHVGFGPQVNLWVDDELLARGGAGLRVAYSGIRLGFDAAVLGNRLESSATSDSTLQEWRPAVGSFQGGDPFRVGVDLSLVGGLRLGLDPDFELTPEIAYSHRLNPVFSSRSIRESDFTVDLLQISLGLSFRI